MPLADVIINRGDRGAAPLAADDVSTRLEAVIAERGPVGVAVDSRSWGMAKASLGDHTSFTTRRAVDQHLFQGGGRVLESRVVGPAARPATLALRDGSAATVLTVTAEGPGVWYHAIRVLVTRGTGNDRIITVSLNGTVISTGTATDADTAADIIEAGGYLRAPLGAGVWPIVASVDTALAGGDDDRANIRQAQVDAALDVFDAEAIEHTPGSLCASAWTTVANHTSLATKAQARNRFARGDMPDIADAATLVADARQIRALGVTAGFIQLLCGYPLVDVAGVQVPVPPSGPLTGREAIADRENKAGPGQPAAWTFGAFKGISGVSQSWSKTDRAALVDAGITPIVQDPETGQVWALDAITAADPVLYPQYSEVAGMRVAMAIQGQLRRVLKQRVMQVMESHVESATEADGVGICADWRGRGALYESDELGPAFKIVVTADRTSRRLIGGCELRTTPTVQTVDFTLTQVAAGDVIQEA